MEDLKISELTEDTLDASDYVPTHRGVSNYKVNLFTAIGNVSGRVLNVNTTSVGNVGAGEDNLMTYSVPGGTLAASGDFISFEAAGTAFNSSDNPRIKVYFGATTIFDSGEEALPISANIVFSIKGKIVRVGATSQKNIVSMTTDNLSIPAITNYTTSSLTLANANTLKLTGEGTSTNDIVQEIFVIEWRPF